MGGRCFKGPYRLISLLIKFQYSKEGFLRDFDVAYLFHALLALLLLFQKLTLTRYVTAVALGGYILAHLLDGLAGNDLGAYGSLDCYIKLLTRYEFL